MTREAVAVSHRYQLHVPAGGLGKSPQILWVGGEDVVAVVGQHDDCGINDIASASSPEQDSDLPAECLVERLNVQPG